MTLVEKVKIFVQPYYDGKDLMHNFSHITRVLKLAEKIAKNYQVDTELLIISAYFHGVIHLDEEKVVNFLQSNKVDEKRIKKIVEIAWDSQKDSTSDLIEGKILHDAHLLEGGKTYLIVKSLVTGTARGQSLSETIKYMEDNVLGKFKCLLPESQNEYCEKEKFAEEFLKDLKKNL
jgi:uncharacterized protein